MLFSIFFFVFFFSSCIHHEDLVNYYIKMQGTTIVRETEKKKTKNAIKCNERECRKGNSANCIYKVFVLSFRSHLMEEESVLTTRHFTCRIRGNETSFLCWFFLFFFFSSSSPPLFSVCFFKLFFFYSTTTLKKLTKRRRNGDSRRIKGQKA